MACCLEHYGKPTAIDYQLITSVTIGPCGPNMADIHTDTHMMENQTFISIAINNMSFIQVCM